MKKIHEKKQNVSFYLCLYPYGWPMSCLVYTKVRIGLLLSTTPTGKYYGQGGKQLILRFRTYSDFMRLQRLRETQKLWWNPNNLKISCSPPRIVIIGRLNKTLGFLYMFTYNVYLENNNTRTHGKLFQKIKL